jgi:hypothetical protein
VYTAQARIAIMDIKEEQMKVPIKLKRIGYVGIVDGKPCFDNTTDNYVALGEGPIPVADVYKTKKEARKRFQEIRSVYFPVLDGKH